MSSSATSGSGNSSDSAGRPDRNDEDGCSGCAVDDGSRGVLLVLAFAAVSRRRARNKPLPPPFLRRIPRLRSSPRMQWPR
ncbi:MYXO-CTERM sorting domain-containing protein [Nannocystis pusilla]|uniref:MYXO-CTERM sorting domain-containing protein n=1 Tax=Nannocystis pusilla TaxID=889268 RepID=UPI003B83024B